MDALGIQTMKFGESRWSSGGPEDIRCWEGLSMRHGILKFGLFKMCVLMFQFAKVADMGLRASSSDKSAGVMIPHLRKRF